MRKGYKEMLRDRCPRTINYALKWQKAKDKWIDHAYTYFIKMLGDEVNNKGNIIRSAKDSKRHVINLLLGIKKGKRTSFDFSKSIDWDNLTDEETVYWKRVSSWVTWFKKNYVFIENTYNISKEKGKDDFDIQIEFIQTYLSWLLPSSDCTQEEKEAKYKYVDRLAEFLMQCIEGKIKLIMLSIFSNYLTPIYGEDLNSKPSEVYEMLRYTYSLGGVGILNNTRMVSVGNDDDDYDIICESFRNEDFKAWIQWVNKKITLELGNVDYRTIDVRLRIAVNMLNKITWNYPHFKKIAFKVHFNLTDNVKREMSAINTEDLPFLG